MAHPLQMTREEFTALGYWLVDQIAEHFDTLDQKKLTPGETPSQVRKALGSGSIPENGLSAKEVLERATDLVMGHSLFPGHPRFWGYIIGSGTQIGVLSEMLAAAANPNVGGWNLAPMATEMEKQVIDWISEFIGYHKGSAGLLVSGGAMANYFGFLVARRAQASWNIREEGLGAIHGQLRVYCSHETHTWIQKAADLFGLGTNAISWIAVDEDLRVDVKALEEAIVRDQENGHSPFMVIATAGTVGAGVIDDLLTIGNLCRKYQLWYHIDGAYGGPAAGLPELKVAFAGIEMADSIALDPHKWFYCPMEAGCILVRNESALTDTFSYRPPYYRFEEYEEAPGISFYEYGLQNSRGFRALKVWTGFLQAGRSGMQALIRHDIEMARLLFELVSADDNFEAFQVNLSITTFRYRPVAHSMSDEELNTLNERIMASLQDSGKAFVSHTIIRKQFYLRACFVNFRTTEKDVRALPGMLLEIAAALKS